MKLNKKLMTRWIEALESGKYRQGRHGLKTKDTNRTKYCCLGVLQKIEPSIPCENEDELYLHADSLRKILGCELEQRHLGDMNDGSEGIDGKRKSFREIAKYLREQYKITA